MNATKYTICLSIVAMSLGTFTRPATAQNWTPEVEMSVVMLEALGPTGIDFSVVADFGEYSRLEFATNVNVGARTFSFGTLAGTTYMGKSASIQTSGRYNEATEIYEWEGSMTLGTDVYSTGGWLEFSELADDDKKFDGKTTVNGAKGTTYLVKETFNEKTKQWESTGRFKYWTKAKKEGDQDEYHDVPVKDKVKAGVETWTMAALQDGSNVGIAIAGLTDFTNSGVGTATMEVGNVVPEPASLSVLSIALGGYLARRRRSKKA